ncbi:MAG: hypothetical protein ACYSYW_08000 [Planctomycetota bacterium]|jgi:Fe2+ or Zn2+ uptake regulation protein
MNADEKFDQYVAFKGLRQTKRRKQIVDVFLATEKHLTVQELKGLATRLLPEQ